MFLQFRFRVSQIQSNVRSLAKRDNFYAREKGVGHSRARSLPANFLESAILPIFLLLSPLSHKYAFSHYNCLHFSNLQTLQTIERLIYWNVVFKLQLKNLQKANSSYLFFSPFNSLQPNRITIQWLPWTSTQTANLEQDWLNPCSWHQNTLQIWTQTHSNFNLLCQRHQLPRVLPLLTLLGVLWLL